jgi:hypothetical protein
VPGSPGGHEGASRGGGKGVDEAKGRVEADVALMEAAQETVSIVMEVEQAARAEDEAVGQDEENMNNFTDFDDKDYEHAMQLMSF